MQRRKNNTATHSMRWENFRHRADHAPQNVYPHRTRAWEYIPIHPFGDEPTILDRLGMMPESCRSVNAWWGIDGDATLLESCVGSPGGLYVKPTPHWERWVYCVVIFDAPFVTRSAFEAAMVRFADAGFPHDPRFQLRDGDPWVVIKGERRGHRSI